MIAELFAAALVFADPLLSYDSARRVEWVNGGGYMRDSYAWHLANSGQPSTLYYKNVVVFSESGANSLNVPLATAPDVLVGLVNPGCDTSLPDLRGVVRYGWTFSKGTSKPGCKELSGGITRVPVGYGTALACLVSAHRNNGTGTAGVAPGTPLVIAAVSLNAADVAAGIVWCALRGAKIVVLDWGTPENNPDLFAACQFALERGVILVCAAPATYQDMDHFVDYPTHWGLPNVIPVVATDQVGNIYASGWGSRTLAAPGRNIVSLGAAGKPIYGSGTSWAAPQVAGCLALLMQRYPDGFPAAWIQALMRTADPIDSGRSRQVNITRALGAKKLMDMRTDRD